MTQRFMVDLQQTNELAQELDEGNLAETLDRVLHTVRCVVTRGEPYEGYWITWSSGVPRTNLVRIVPLDSGKATLVIENDGSFQPEKLFGPVALAFFQCAESSILMTDTAPTLWPGPRIIFVNDALVKTTGYTVAEVVGKTPRVFQGPRTSQDACDRMANAFRQWEHIEVDVINYRKDGTEYEVNLNITPVQDDTGWFAFWLSIQKDVTEDRRREAELQLARRLESIGQLAAGVAHEINTPIQYIGDNIAFLKKASGSLCEALESYEEALESSNVDDRKDIVARKRSQLRLDFLLPRIPRALSSAAEGVVAVSNIVAAMKEFSHPGGQDPVLIDLNRVIDTTLRVCRNEYKHVADIDLDLDPNLPSIFGYPEINQVFLNIIVNAAHAIAEGTSSEPGRITISTRRSGEQSVEIIISDDGSGISDDNLKKIFDPFFTTKDLGQGTGQGLAIAWSVVVDKHRGSLQVESTEGIGTTFRISLPTQADIEMDFAHTPDSGH